MNSSVIVVGGKDFQIENFFQLGVSFILIQNQQDLTSRQVVIADKVIELDYADITLLKEAVASCNESSRIKAIFSFTEFGLYPTAVVANELSIKSNCSLHATTVSRDKELMRCLIQDSEHAENVHFCKVDNREDVIAFYQQHGSSFIIKPNEGVGSFGVRLVTSEDDILDYFSAMSGRIHQEFICESYVDGKEYSVETLSTNGQHQVIAITEKMINANFVEAGHYQPADLSSQMVVNIHNAVQELLTKIQHLHGPCHTEIKIDNQRIYVIETQTRTGGDRIWQLTELTTGVNLYKHTIATLLKNGLTYQPSPPRFNAAISRFPMLPPRQIASVFTDFTPAPEIIENEFNPEIGQQVQPVRSSSDRLGFLVIGAATVDAAERIYDNYLSTLNIEFYENHD